MNCFEWSNLLLISFERGLSEADKRAFKLHETQCEQCRKRKSNQMKIHETLKALESHVWADRNKSHNQPITPETDLDLSEKKTSAPQVLTLRKRWDLIPWYLKILIESLTVISLSFTVVKSGQWLIGARENEIDSQVEQIDFSPETKMLNGTPPGLTKEPLQNTVDASIPQDDYLEDDEGAGEVTIEVGRSEIWRFYIKTDNPAELRNQVQELLKQIRVFDGTPGTNGIEAPGGVQFSFFMPVENVNTLMNSLSALAPKVAPAQLGNDSSLSQLFTWYKKKSLQAIPKGQARVIIWLSQL